MNEFLTVWLQVSQKIFVRYFIIAGVAYLLFYVLLKNKLVHQKLQSKFPERARIIFEMLHSVQTILIFAACATLVIGIFNKYTNMYANISDYGMNYYLLTFPLMFLIHDTYFYWMHRFMHLPVVFNYVHLVHHKSTNPTPWASYSFHFLESLLETAIIPIIAFTLPVHKSALILFLLLQLIYNVYGHLGFELYPRNFSKSVVGKWINTSVAHNMHHKYFTGNYGLYFLFWDRWMGTLNKDYDKACEE